MLNENDQHAVAGRLGRGDRTAWTALYDAYSDEVWRSVARLLGGEAATVADVVQEVFLAAAKNARKYDPQRGTLGAWLAGIAHHAVAAHWREIGRQNKLRALVESGQAEIRGLLNNAEPLEALLQRRELVDLVRYVLTQLSADYAALLTAKYLDEQSLESMAEQTGLTTEAVKSKLARARREFRTKFEYCSGAGFQPARKL